MKINIVTQLSYFIVFAVLMNKLGFYPLLLVAILLTTVLIQIKSRQFFRMIRRMKWFFITMLFIYAFNTPGEHILGFNFYFAPTYEGLQSGLLQMLRMLSLLGALSLIMNFNSKQQLISGFYFMLLPLRYVGIKVERFAARLCLTLDYVESAQQLNKSKGFLEQLLAFAEDSSEQQSDFSITFKKPDFKWLDKVLLCSLMMISVVALVKALM